MATTSAAPVGAFGRKAVSDPRDLWYLLADREPQAIVGRPLLEPVRLFRGPVYDQGAAPTDVACALLAALHASPDRMGPARCPDVAWLDARARRIEGALGPTLTLRSGCRALKESGRIASYAWAYDVADVVGYLGSGRGGLVLGLDWYRSMDHPDKQGLIRSWGPPLGGHAVFAWGYDPRSDVVLIQNSRGEDWGGWSARVGRRDFKGCARLPSEDLKKLLYDNGEAVALEKVPTVGRWGHE